MKKLVLASESPRRRELLEMIGLSFRVAKSNVEEKFNPRLRARGQAEYLSLQKAQAVAERFVDAIIIGVDEVVTIDSDVLGKPDNNESARRMLEKLQGRVHRVITAYTIIDSATKRTLTESVETKVYMRRISRKEMEWYIATGEPFDKAGGYGIQGKGSVFIEKIEGDYFTVVGLPISSLILSLRKFGVSLS